MPSHAPQSEALCSPVRTNFGVPLPKRNFGFEKRQKELEKQRKRAQKLLRRTERSAEAGADPEVDGPADDVVDSAPQSDVPSE